MTFMAFPEYRPDVNDFNGSHTQVLQGVYPRGDGYGPVQDILAYTSALPGACRGHKSVRNTDGTIVGFAATADRLFKLNNTDLTWIPVSKVTALTSISNGSPAVFTLASHGLSNGDAIVLSTSDTLPTGLTVGTVYYVINASTNDFNVSTTSGGSAVNTTGAGAGTHSMTYFYSSVPTTGQWQFEVFGTKVIAVQENVAPQVFDISSDSAFSNLGGSPPQARNVAVVGRFLVLTGLTSNPLRAQWSDLDDITVWTAGTGYSNYVDLPDGGIVRGVAGGEFGVIFQEEVIRRLTYVPGAKPAFQIERITEQMGLLGPYAVARASDRVFFISQYGIHEYRNGVGIINIGKERVDRTLIDDIDDSNLQLLMGSADPTATRVLFAYKSIGSSDTTAFDKIIAYDYALERFSPPLSISGEFIAAFVKPGFTLESLDSIDSSIENISFSFDTVQAALATQMSAFDTSHKLSFFQGDNLEATLETPEQGIGGRRVRVSGVEVRTDSATVYCKMRYRSNAQASLSSTSESSINSQGVCPQNIDARLARASVRIPAATSWTYAMGVEPTFKQTGIR